MDKKMVNEIVVEFSGLVNVLMKDNITFRALDVYNMMCKIFPEYDIGYFENRQLFAHYTNEVMLCHEVEYSTVYGFVDSQYSKFYYSVDEEQKFDVNIFDQYLDDIEEELEEELEEDDIELLEEDEEITKTFVLTDDKLKRICIPVDWIRKLGWDRNTSLVAGCFGSEVIIATVYDEHILRGSKKIYKVNVSNNQLSVSIRDMFNSDIKTGTEVFGQCYVNNGYISLIVD